MLLRNENVFKYEHAYFDLAVMRMLCCKYHRCVLYSLYEFFPHGNGERLCP